MESVDGSGSVVMSIIVIALAPDRKSGEASLFIADERKHLGEPRRNDLAFDHAEVPRWGTSTSGSIPWTRKVTS